MPFVNCVSDPDKPDVNVLFPEKALSFARRGITDVSTLIVTSPEVPPPVSPVPAVTPVMSPTFPVIVTCPLEAEAIEIPAPATRYEVPSVN